MQSILLIRSLSRRPFSFSFCPSLSLFSDIIAPARSLSLSQTHSTVLSPVNDNYIYVLAGMYVGVCVCVCSLCAIPFFFLSSTTFCLVHVDKLSLCYI